MPLIIHLFVQNAVYPDRTIVMLFEEDDMMADSITQKSLFNLAIISCKKTRKAGKVLYREI